MLGRGSLGGGGIGVGKWSSAVDTLEKPVLTATGPACWLLPGSPHPLPVPFLFHISFSCGFFVFSNLTLAVFSSTCKMSVVSGKELRRS